MIKGKRNPVFAIYSAGFAQAMIQNKHKLDELQRKLETEESLSYLEALAIYEMLHNEAVSLGAINSDNILEGLEVDLRIAQAINKVGL